MLAFLSLLSRYYFVFLIAYFLLQSGYHIFKGKGRHHFLVILLFNIFAFAILSFDANMLHLDMQALTFGGLAMIFAIGGPFLIKRVYSRPCPLITYIMFFLLSIGFIMLQRLNPGLATRQLLIAALGLLVSMFVPLIFRIFGQFEKLQKLFALLCLALIGIVSVADAIGALTGFPIVSVDGFGAAHWVAIGGVAFQPAEFAKPIFVLYLASAFRVKPTLGKLVFSGGMAAAMVGILVMQRNLGSALMFFVIFMVMLYTATGSKALFATGFGGMGVGSFGAYHLFSHVRIRVLAWSDPWPYIANQGFQLTQSLFAIATWGPFGAGLGRGMPYRIPIVERDVIFSAISEEFGWIFALLIICLYAALLLQGVNIAKKAKRPLHALMSIGFTTFLVFQAFVSIGGNIRLIPMTGITLPFVSFGGTSVFVSMLMVGALNWLNGQHNHNNDDDEPNEKSLT